MNVTFSCVFNLKIGNLRKAYKTSTFLLVKHSVSKHIIGGFCFTVIFALRF